MASMKVSMDTFASLFTHQKYPWILLICQMIFWKYPWILLPPYLLIKSIHGYFWFVKWYFESIHGYFCLPIYSSKVSMDTFASIISMKNIHGYFRFVRPQRLIFLLSCRGQKYIQQHQNVLPIRSMRRGGFRFEDKILNPNEKSLQCCGWAVQAFTKPGMFKSLSFILACRWLCLVTMCWKWVNARGLSSLGPFLFGHRSWRYVILKNNIILLGYQFRGASARIAQSYNKITRTITEHYEGDLTR